MRKKEMRNCYWDKTNRNWRVQVGVNNRNVFVGTFRSLEEAQAARDDWYAANGGPRKFGCKSESEA